MKKTFISILFILIWSSGILAQHTWVKIHSPIVGRHQAIDFFSADSGYVMGDSALFFSYNGGSTWLERKLPDTKSKNMHFLNADTGVIKLLSGRIFHTVDGGISWQENVLDSINTLDIELYRFHFGQGSTFGFISNLCHKCYSYHGSLIPYTTNGGVDWSIRKTDGAYQTWDLAFRSPQVGIGLFDNGIMRHFLASTNDSGNHWTRRDSGIEKILGDGYQATITSLQNGHWLASFGNTTFSSFFYTSTDDGVSWVHTSSVNSEVHSTAFFDNFGYAVVGFGIFSTTDYGNHWISDNDPLFAFPISLSVPSAQVAYCITDSVILKTDSRNKVNITALQSNVRVTFNPISSSADFQFDALKKPTVFELFDILGRSLLRQQVSAGQASLHVNMQNMPAGIYFARLGGETVRFIKLKA